MWHECNAAGNSILPRDRCERGGNTTLSQLPSPKEWNESNMTLNHLGSFHQRELVMRLALRVPFSNNREPGNAITITGK